MDTLRSILIVETSPTPKKIYNIWLELKKIKISELNNLAISTVIARHILLEYDITDKNVIIYAASRYVRAYRRELNNISLSIETN